MTCHNCEHNATIERLRKTCAACRLSDVATRNSVSLDALPGTADAGEIGKLPLAPGVSLSATFDSSAMMDGDAQEVRRLVPSMPEGSEEWLLGLLRAFADLSLAELTIVHGLLRGWSFATMAERYGASKAAISARLKSATRRHPWLAVVRATVARRKWRERNDPGHADTAKGDLQGARWVYNANTKPKRKKAFPVGYLCPPAHRRNEQRKDGEK